MSILNLSTTESKQLLLLHSKLDYDSPKRVHQIYDLIESKNYFSSEDGIRYKNALAKMLEGRIPFDCIYCGATLGEHDNLICPDCERELKQRVHKDNKKRNVDMSPYDGLYDVLSDGSYENEFYDVDTPKITHLDDYLSYRGSVSGSSNGSYDEEYYEDDYYEDEEEDFTSSDKKLNNIIVFLLFALSFSALIIMRILFGN